MLNGIISLIYSSTVSIGMLILGSMPIFAAMASASML